MVEVNFMFSLFFDGIQQDLQIAILPPVLCALFHLIFIEVYRPKKNPFGEWRKWLACFRYGFWWGMDFNAYVFLLLVIFVSLPGAFLPTYFAVGDTIRQAAVTIYAVVLYTAFLGKMIFYYHYHDIYNSTLWLGKKAEKHNLLDIFFHQNHGVLLILSYIPYTLLCWWAGGAFLSIPQLTYYLVPSGALQIAINTAIVIGVALIFYYFRYGGTLIHDNKPEWDTIPSIVKEDIFMARATVDDLVALENVLKHPLQEGLSHTDEEDEPVIDAIMPEAMKGGKWKDLQNPAEAFVHEAKGARIKKIKHIFLIVGESYAQMPLDDIYSDYHIMDGAKAFRQDPHTVSLNNFLPAGMISRPAIVSLMTGIFDAKLELNEREDFWHGTLTTTLPNQLRKLGYRSIYWYGGNPTYGNFDKFGPAVGFDKVMGATEFCPPDSPKTWVGVYDHIFLQHAAELIQELDDDTPTFHYIYTTSNHGPYKMPLKKLGFDADAVLKDLPESVRHNHKKQKILGTYWYSDKAISDFVEEMERVYPDALFIVTGDHASIPIHPGDTLTRQDVTLREQFCTSFAMHHPELTQDILSGNTIGGHMNIMPTIFELIAPKGFSYYSLVPSLTEPIDHVVTPYHWLTKENVGSAQTPVYQSTVATDQELPTEESAGIRYADEIAGVDALTAWIVRHPEMLSNFR